MCTCTVLKKIWIVYIACMLLVGGHISAVQQHNVLDGMEQQINCLSEAVNSYLSSQITAKQLNEVEFVGKIQHEVDALGLNLDVFCKKQHAPDSRIEYSLFGRNKLTNDDICNIRVGRSENGSYKIEVAMDPNHDGCINESECGYLVVGKAVQAMFKADRRAVKEATKADFMAGDCNVYKIVQKPSLWQAVNGPCGYYALYNILQIYNYQDSCKNLLDRGLFEPLYADWKAHAGIISLSNYDIKSIIENRVPELAKSNVIISVSDINAQNKMLNNEVFCFEGTTVEQQVADFQENGTEQYVILGTGVQAMIPGVHLYWDNSNNRHACVKDHWIAFKIEWQDKTRPGKCPVIITVADSSGTKDDRYAAPIHWMYRVFMNGLV